jgi:hypothetical protein
MGARVAEIDEDAVAHVLGDKAVIMPDRVTAAALIRRDHIAQIFRVHPGGERRRSDQIAKHHGQLAALGVRHRGDCGRGSRSLVLPQGPVMVATAPRARVGHASLGRPDQYLSVDIRRHPLDDDQLATQFFETILIETKAELDAAIGDAALGDEAPEDLLQHPLKVHASVPVRRDLRRSLMACPRPASRRRNRYVEGTGAGGHASVESHECRLQSPGDRDVDRVRSAEVDIKTP